MREDSGNTTGGSRLRLPSPAMAVALLALFVALGGSAWAVSNVGTNQLKNNAVTTPKIRASAVNASRLANGAVTGPKIAPGAVGPAGLGPGAVGFDALADSAVQGSKIAPLAVGSGSLANGSVTATKLAEGAVGGSNVSVTSIYGDPFELPEGGAITLSANCPQGRKAISAGLDSNAVVWIYASYVSLGTAFVGVANKPGNPPVQVTPQAVCL